MRFLRDNDRMHPGERQTFWGKREWKRKEKKRKKNLTFRGFKRFRDSPRCFNVNLTSCTFPNTSRVDLDFSFPVPQTAFKRESGHKIRNGCEKDSPLLSLPRGATTLNFRQEAALCFVTGISLHGIILDKNVRRCALLLQAVP